MSEPRAIYEVLIRGTEAGEIAGAHVIYWEPDGTDRNGTPRFALSNAAPLHLADVEDTLTDGLYAAGAQFQRAQADLAAAQAEIARLQARIAELTPAPPAAAD
jgi:hypothetical protein